MNRLVDPLGFRFPMCSLGSKWKGKFLKHQRKLLWHWNIMLAGIDLDVTVFLDMQSELLSVPFGQKTRHKKILGGIKMKYIDP